MLLCVFLMAQKCRSSPAVVAAHAVNQEKWGVNWEN